MTPDREQAYQDEIRRLQDAVESITRAALDEATRLRGVVAAEKRAGDMAVQRIRGALLEGASDEAQWTALDTAFRMVRDFPDDWAMRKNAAAYLALAESHRDARAELAALREGIDRVRAGARGAA